MAKAQSFFGGTKPKETGKNVNGGMGKTGSTSGGGINITRKTTVKQAKPRQIYSEKKKPNNPLSFERRSSVSRPTGKEDNRTSWR